MLIEIKFRKGYAQTISCSCCRVAESKNQLILDIDGEDPLIYDFDQLDFYQISNGFI